MDTSEHEKPEDTTAAAAMEEKEPKTLTLKSSDGQEFTILSNAASFAEILNNVVGDDCANSIIPVPTVDGKTLAKVISYLDQRVRVPNTEDDREKFHAEFLEGEEDKNLNDLILAAIHMNIKDLRMAGAKKIADRIKNKSVKWVRKAFGITDGYSKEEEDRIRNGWYWGDSDCDSD